MDKKKIKVLHIGDKFGVKGSSIHGVSRLFSWWFPRFDHERFDVHLIGLRQSDAASENLRQQGIEVVTLNRGKFDFFTIRDLVRYIRSHDIDIVHLHGYGATNFGRMAAKITKTKIVVHEHVVDPSMPFYQVPFDYFLSGWTDFSIAVSHSVKDFMVRNRKLPETKVRVIYNGAPLREFEPMDKETVPDEKRKWNIPPDDHVVTTVGRLDEQKGNRYLVEAAAEILGKRKDVSFVIAGDGPYLQDLKEQASRLGIQDKVVFTGYCSDVRRVQAITDIQAFPSLWEGTPLTLFEAMSMKLPIVSTDVDGLGEVLIHDETALLIPPRDSKSLALALEDLLDNPQKAARLAERAKSDSSRFDIQNTVDQMQNVYEDLMG